MWSPRTSWCSYDARREQNNGSRYWTPEGLWMLLQTCHQLQQSLHSETSTLVLYSRMFVVNQNKQKPKHARHAVLSPHVAKTEDLGMVAHLH